MPTSLRLPSREIPTPRTISAEAQEFLQGFHPVPEALPAIDDFVGWTRWLDTTSARFEPLIDRIIRESSASHAEGQIRSVPVYIATPANVRDDDVLHIFLHGGGWSLMGGRCCAALGMQWADALGFLTYSVDYRMVPHHPFPAAVEDVVAVYCELLNQNPNKKIVISGPSAGGNLAAAATLRVRDDGLRMPAAVGLFTPALDLTAGGDSVAVNFGADIVLLTPLAPMFHAYAREENLHNVYLSPLYADFSAGFPPTFLQAGTRDLLLSDAVRMHRALLRAKVRAELHVWEGMPHGGFGGFSEEDRETRSQFLEFLESTWSK